MSLPQNPQNPIDSNTDIHGGNNQLLPNATHAVQHNNYDNQAPKHTLDVRSSLL